MLLGETEVSFFVLDDLFDVFGVLCFGDVIGIYVKPAGLEVDVAVAVRFAGILNRFFCRQSNYCVRQSDFAIAARLVANVALVDAPCPMLDLLAVSTTDWAIAFCGFCWCCVATG